MTMINNRALFWQGENWELAVKSQNNNEIESVQFQYCLLKHNAKYQLETSSFTVNTLKQSAEMKHRQNKTVGHGWVQIYMETYKTQISIDLKSYLAMDTWNWPN